MKAGSLFGLIYTRGAADTTIAGLETFFLGVLLLKIARFLSHLNFPFGRDCLKGMRPGGEAVGVVGETRSDEDGADEEFDAERVASTGEVVGEVGVGGHR